MQLPNHSGRKADGRCKISPMHQLVATTTGLCKEANVVQSSKCVLNIASCVLSSVRLSPLRSPHDQAPMPRLLTFTPAEQECKVLLSCLTNIRLPQHHAAASDSDLAARGGKGGRVQVGGGSLTCKSQTACLPSRAAKTGQPLSCIQAYPS